MRIDTNRVCGPDRRYCFRVGRSWPGLARRAKASKPPTGRNSNASGAFWMPGVSADPGVALAGITSARSSIPLRVVMGMTGPSMR